MCKYCMELENKGVSNKLLSDDIPIGIRKDGLISTVAMLINGDNTPAIEFAIGVGPDQGSLYDVYFDDIPIQYCPFCGRNILKELAE